MLRPVRLRIYAHAHLSVPYIDYKQRGLLRDMAICDLSFVSALLTMIKFSMHKRVRILNS